jgi:hypothetical protein
VQAVNLGTVLQTSASSECILRKFFQADLISEARSRAPRTQEEDTVVERRAEVDKAAEQEVYRPLESAATPSISSTDKGVGRRVSSGNISWGGRARSTGAAAGRRTLVRGAAHRSAVPAHMDLVEAYRLWPAAARKSGPPP